MKQIILEGLHQLMSFGGGVEGKSEFHAVVGRPAGQETTVDLGLDLPIFLPMNLKPPDPGHRITSLADITQSVDRDRAHIQGI